MLFEHFPLKKQRPVKKEWISFQEEIDSLSQNIKKGNCVFLLPTLSIINTHHICLEHYFN